MPLSLRTLRRSTLFNLCILCGLCAPHRSAAQGAATGAQFVQPTVVPTSGGPVASFVTGDFDNNGLTDFLYISAPITVGGLPQISAGMLLQQSNGSFLDLPGNRLTFSDVSNVVVATGDFDGDGILDYAFATSSTVGGTYLCVYYGSGDAAGGSAYSASKSGCMTFPLQQGVRGDTLVPPDFAYIATFPFTTGGRPNLVVEEINDNYDYILANNGQTATTPGVLSSFTAIPIFDNAYALGWGPMYTGDLDGDGNTDLLITPQNGVEVNTDVEFGDGTGGFEVGSGSVSYSSPGYSQFRSTLLHDMNGDGRPDLVTEDAPVGALYLQLGTGERISGTPPPGTTSFDSPTLISPTGLDGRSGNGGHLIATVDLNGDGILDLLTATPTGISVLLGQGDLTYKLAGIYNAGPGHSCYAVADFNGDGKLDLAVDSPEGIAILYGNGDGTFQTSRAYAALQPALSATVADFNGDGKPDVAVGTEAIQAQVLTGNGDGTFNTLPALTDTLSPPNPLLWSMVQSGDFNGDGKQDLAYSLTGLPLPIPGPNAGSGLYLQTGNGDGTFAPPVALAGQITGVPGNNTFYGASAVGDFNGDGIADIANVDTNYFDTLLGQGAALPQLGLNAPVPGAPGSSANFPLVATGFFRNAGNGVSSRLRVAGGGPQDMVYVDGTAITPYLNSGDGIHFTAMPPLSSPPNLSDSSQPRYYPATVLLRDMDGDGNGDVVIVYHNLAANPATPSASTPNQVYIWYGNGDGTFGAPVATTLTRNDYLAVAADMNGDGLPDLVLSDGYLVDILYNGGAGLRGSFGNPATSQRLLAGQGINSISVADVNGDGQPDVIVANGGAAISNPVALGGGPLSPLTLLTLPPNPDVNTGGITVLINTSTAKAALIQTGVSLALCIEGSSTFPCPANPSLPPPILTPLQMSYGQVLNGTASPSSEDGSTLSPSSTVTFYQSGTAICTVPAVPGTLCPAMAGMAIPPGTYTFTAVYNGDSTHAPSTSNAVDVIVQPDTTLAVLVSSLNPSVVGQSVTFTATLSGNGAAPTGPAVFMDGATVIGTVTLTPGATNSLASTATFTTSALPVGTDLITVTYAATPDFGAATSPALQQVVEQNSPTTVTLASSLNPAGTGQSVTFTASISDTTAITPTGAVTFMDGATLLATQPLTGGAPGTASASFSIGTLSLGTHVITATYVPTGSFQPGAATLTETIVPQDFTITLANPTLTLETHSHLTTTLTLTSLYGFADSLALTCTGLPAPFLCRPTPTTATLAAKGTTTVSLYLDTESVPSDARNLLGSHPGDPIPSPIGLALLLSPASLFLALRTWRSQSRASFRLLFFLLAALPLILALSGCGTAIFSIPSAAPGKYIIPITATGSSTGITHTAQLTLTVTP